MIVKFLLRHLIIVEHAHHGLEQLVSDGQLVFEELVARAEFLQSITLLINLI